MSLLVNTSFCDLLHPWYILIKIRFLLNNLQLFPPLEGSIDIFWSCTTDIASSDLPGTPGKFHFLFIRKVLIFSGTIQYNFLKPSLPLGNSNPSTLGRYWYFLELNFPPLGSSNPLGEVIEVLHHDMQVPITQLGLPVLRWQSNNIPFLSGIEFCLM